MPKRPPSAPAPSEPHQPHGQVSAAARSESVKRSSGPIPDPETLAQYDKVHPGLAATIVTAFEAMQLDHADIRRGQWLGFIICIVGLVAGSVLVYPGHDAAGAAIGGGSLASLVAAYFTGQKHKTTEAKPDQVVRG